LRNNSQSDYLRRRDKVITACKSAQGKIHFSRGSSSNLFRYRSEEKGKRSIVSLSEFNHILSLDRQAQTLETEALITFEELVKYSLARGFLPKVAPELKHITLAGATVGIGIESSCFRYGFVHDGVIDADVLLPGGRMVTCKPDNDCADLFRGLPNSYGTLGYLLRAKIALIPAKPYVQVDNVRFNSIVNYLEAMEKACNEPQNDFVEGLFYSDNELYLTTGRMVENATQTEDIYRHQIYYKLLREGKRFYLSTFDYIFRYDPDWFWNLPEGGFYSLFRLLAPRAMRSSGFYKRYTALKHRVRGFLGVNENSTLEPLIQDWELPWEHTEEFLRYALEQVDQQGQPWIAVPIRTPNRPTNYPVRPGALYCNIGSYCHTYKPRQDIDFYYTRILDHKCFELGGIKMLYSSSFVKPEEFSRIYNGEAYAELKQKYDPGYQFGDLYEKCVANS
jgi:FAD/FMN-containing dehydrogenase